MANSLSTDKSAQCGKEDEERFDRTVKQLLKTPPKPHKDFAVGKGDKRKPSKAERSAAAKNAADARWSE